MPREWEVLILSRKTGEVIYFEFGDEGNIFEWGGRKR